MSRRLFGALCVMVLLCATLPGQDAEPQGTLPPVEVRPPAGANASGNVSDETESLGDLDFSDAFPSLSDQLIGGASLDPGGLNSILRSEQSLFEMPQLGTIVDRNALDERMSNNMFRALQNEVGVTLQQTGNGQVSPFIRGLTGQQVLILVDGVRLNNSVLRAGPNQYASTIDPGMIERIEVVRGAQSVLWGSDALGGAINIVTRGADPLHGDYSRVSFQQFLGSADASSYSRGNVEGWVGGTGVFAGGSYLNTNDLDIGGGLGRQPATGYGQHAGDIKFSRMVGDTAMLTVALQHFEQNDLARSDRFLPFVLGPAPNGSSGTQRPTFFDPQQRDLAYIRLQGVADIDNGLYDTYSATVSYSRTKEGTTVDRYSSNASAAVPTRREIGEFTDDMIGVNLAASKDLDDLGRLTYGSDYFYEDIDSRRVRINSPTSPGAMPTPTDPQYPDDAIADRFGAFLNWDGQLTDRWSANAGIRYENLNLSATPNFDTVGLVHFDRTYQDWIGSIGLGYELTEELRMVGGVYEGFRAPTIDDLTANKTAIQNVQTVPRLGDLNIQPEHTRTYEVGFKYDSDRVRFQVYEWWTDFRSVIGREFIGTDQFLANQEAYLNGTEAYGEYLLDPYWSLYGNFTYTYGQNRDTDEPFSRIPPTQGIVGLRWRDKSLASYFDIYTWLVRRQDRYASANLGDVRFIPAGTPGYATLNLRAGTALGQCQQHRVSLSLENITDKYYRVLGSGVDGAGFNAIVGYEFVH
ncbi:MAG: TonB-dependent receptor [Planctomycetota bacterium]|nr:TonB-dependent receptor [Planctomycetota bacterium]